MAAAPAGAAAAAAAESSSSSSSRSRAAADSYIGSLISLTSKFEIRYEGILYNINTEESSIGLRNVRSFGTEGRKKDGPQIPASDKIYEYILFRGSDIKDLQVKSSPPAPPAPPMHNDPAIIQSHFPRPASASVSTSTTIPSSGTRTEADSSHTSQTGLPRPTFQGGPSLYQPGGSLGTWGSAQPPPTANGSGLGMPAMYWPGYYAPLGGLPHLQQPPFLPQPSGLPMPQGQTPLQYPGMNVPFSSGMPNLSDYPPPLFQPVSSSFNLASNTLPSTSTPALSSVLPSEIQSSLIASKPFPSSLPGPGLNPPLMPPASSVDSAVNISDNVPAAVRSRPKMGPSPTLPYQTIPHPMPLTIPSLSSNQVKTSVPSVTPDQMLLHDRSTLLSSQPQQANLDHMESELPDVKAKPSVAEPQAQNPDAAALEVKEPILPLPRIADPKPSGATSNTQYSNRGRERGRGHEYGQRVTKFMEDFDFTAMNEKFRKDEVWGSLGKSKASYSRVGEYAAINDEANEEEEPSTGVKPVYVKDDFFDMLSCNTLGQGAQNGRPKFSEQMKLDTETFGDFPRHRPGRGRGRGPRGGGGGGNMRGSYSRGGYGYARRGRGSPMHGRAPW